MAERNSGIEEIELAIAEAPIDWVALQTNADRLRWKVPEDFDGVFRTALGDYAVSIGRYLWYAAAYQMIQEKGPNLQVLPKVAKNLLENSEMAVFRTKYEFGYGLGQDAVLNHVASAILQNAGISSDNALIKS